MNTKPQYVFEAWENPLRVSDQVRAAVRAQLIAAAQKGKGQQ